MSASLLRYGFVKNSLDFQARRKPSRTPLMHCCFISTCGTGNSSPHTCETQCGYHLRPSHTLGLCQLMPCTGPFTVVCSNAPTCIFGRVIALRENQVPSRVWSPCAHTTREWIALNAHARKVLAIVRSLGFRSNGVLSLGVKPPAPGVCKAASTEASLCLSFYNRFVFIVTVPGSLVYAHLAHKEVSAHEILRCSSAIAN